MKKILYLLIICCLFASCATVRSANDYDSTTYEKKNFKNCEILGTVTVSTLGFTWESLSPTDRKSVNLMNRLENKALKQYGNNIDLINVEIGGMSPGITIPLWVSSGVGMTALALIGTEVSSVETTDKYGQTKKTTDSEKMLPFSLGLLGCGSLFFFKGIKAEAVVIKSDTPYKKNPTSLLSDDDIDLRRSEYKAEKRRKAEQADKENVPPFIFTYSKSINNTTYAFIDSKIWITDNFKSGKDVIQMEDKDYGIIMGKAKDDNYWFTFKIQIKNDDVTITFYDYYQEVRSNIITPDTHTEWNYLNAETSLIADKFFNSISQ